MTERGPADRRPPRRAAPASRGLAPPRRSRVSVVSIPPSVIPRGRYPSGRACVRHLDAPSPRRAVIPRCRRGRVSPSSRCALPTPRRHPEVSPLPQRSRVSPSSRCALPTPRRHPEVSPLPQRSRVSVISMRPPHAAPSSRGVTATPAVAGRRHLDAPSPRRAVIPRCRLYRAIRPWGVASASPPRQPIRLALSTPRLWGLGRSPSTLKRIWFPRATPPVGSFLFFVPTSCGAESRAEGVEAKKSEECSGEASGGTRSASKCWGSAPDPRAAALRGRGEWAA